MNLTMSSVSGFLSTALVALLPPALGPDGGSRCAPRVDVEIDRLAPRNFYVPRAHYIDGPGGLMRGTVTREHNVIASFGRGRDAQTSITIDDLVRELHTLGFQHVEARHKVFAGHEFRREISKGRYGHLRFRVLGYRVNWSAWSVLGTCRRVKIDSGVASVPARAEGWRYRETRRPRPVGS